LEKNPKRPEVDLILGSGLGVLADEIEGLVTISYTDIPGFTVPGAFTSENFSKNIKG